MNKSELKNTQEKLSRVMALVREPKYKKLKCLIPTKYPNMKLTEILELTSEIVEMIIELKNEEPDEGELWLVDFNGLRSVGEITDGKIYMIGDELGYSFSEVKKFIRKIDLSE